MKKWWLALLITGLFTTAPYAHDDHTATEVTVEQAWARKTSRTVSAAVYLELHNDGHVMDTLTGISSPVAETVSLHRSYEKDGMMRMDHVDELPVAPGEVFTLAPGGYHIMLMNLSHPLEEGSTFPVTLHFKKAGNIETIVTVTGMGGLE
ncbi:copper chaperone PCu(A)C [Kordiimonas pumila]|uniref:Copper chaperone PCu(A)C n=1 Tax=Kordiimonas pumila TaxID=2161677 RepID=A0ABV7CZV7_9PROT|nr:copper chaperone PCu(A)C [Kordiimonas pumila]